MSRIRLPAWWRGSSLSADDKHRLFYLNRGRLWLFKGAVKSPVEGEAVLSQDIRQLGRKLFHRALAQHARPHFRHYHPQLDQRSVKLLAAKQATTFPLWAKISTLTPGKTIALPVVAWPALMDTVGATSAALANTQAEQRLAKQQRAAEKRKSKGLPPTKSQHEGRSATLCSLPQTIRLIVRQNDPLRPHAGLHLALGLVVDHADKRAQACAAYTPVRGKMVAFDLGVATLLATSDGDLLGRGWRAQLERLDAALLGIARGQQKRGLPVATPRYRSLTQ